VVILNPVLAVIAAIGFSMVFKVRKEHIWMVGFLAFFGFLVRDFFVFLGVGLELSVLAGAFCVGLSADLIGYKTKIPLQMLKVPAGIPMIPGSLVFEAIKNLIAFVSLSAPDGAKLSNFFYFGGKSIFILAALAFGLTATSVIFNKR
jgi:uncharacterized membrane protein YjjB (DUF3815 family)